MHKKTLAALCLATATTVAGSAFPADSAHEAARIGNDLTPLRAERAGKADGSVPPWN